LLVGVTVREYRELEAGDRMPDNEVRNRICKPARLAADLRGFGWWMNTRPPAARRITTVARAPHEIRI